MSKDKFMHSLDVGSIFAIVSNFEKLFLWTAGFLNGV